MLLALTLVALGIGGLGAVLSYLLAGWLADRPRPAGPSPVVPALGVGLLLTVLLFALTLPATPPFSPGLRLGWGVLIGGLFGAMAALGTGQLARAEQRPWPSPSLFALSLSLMAVSLSLLLFRGDPEEALLGCALGFGMLAGLVWVTVPSQEVVLPVGAAGVLTALLAAACALSIHHFNTPERRGWWAYPLILVGAWLLGHTVALVLARRPGWPGLRGAPAASGVLAAVLVALVGVLLAQRLESKEMMWPVLAAGLVTGALVVWLSASVAMEEAPEPRLKAGALGVLIMLFLLAVTFKLMQAVGTGVALLAAFGVVAAGLALGSRVAGAPVLLMAMGADYLLLRLFLERAGVSAGRVEPDLHYTLVGLLLGVVLPFLYVSFRERPGVGRAVLLGLLGVGSPVVLAALWGQDAAVGFLGGLVVAPALAAFLPVAVGPVGLLSLGLALVAAQLGPSFSVIYQIPRMEKIYLAGGLALVVVVWIAVLAIARLRPGAATQPQEG